MEPCEVRMRKNILYMLGTVKKFSQREAIMSTIIIEVSKIPDKDLLERIIVSSYGKDGKFWDACISSDYTFILDNLINVFAGLSTSGKPLLIDPKEFFMELPESERNSLLSKFSNLMKIGISYIHKQRSPIKSSSSNFSVKDTSGNLVPIIYQNKFMEHINIQDYSLKSNLVLMYPPKI